MHIFRKKPRTRLYDNNGEPISSSEQIVVNDEFLQVIKDTFVVYNRISDTVIYSNLFNRRIISEFKSQINNEYADETGSIELTIKDKTVTVEAKQIEELNAKLNPDKHVH